MQCTSLALQIEMMWFLKRIIQKLQPTCAAKACQIKLVIKLRRCYNTHNKTENWLTLILAPKTYSNVIIFLNFEHLAKSHWKYDITVCCKGILQRYSLSPNHHRKDIQNQKLFNTFPTLRAKAAGPAIHLLLRFTSEILFVTKHSSKIRDFLTFFLP